ncbi:MAG: serine/threonine-protein kinase [Xenococcaceae cyanobacterium MO_188.B32]|nr:serine/threonine-protein kinase [Xenococcaceae cyanobacterium MO_188.B32]
MNKIRSKDNTTNSNHCICLNCEGENKFTEHIFQSRTEILCQNSECNKTLVLQGNLIQGSWYLPIKLLGAGGFGRTFLAWKIDPNGQRNKCVIKKFAPQSPLSGDVLQKTQERFKREAEILNKLSQQTEILNKLSQQKSRIPQLIDFFFPKSLSSANISTEQQFPYIVQQYIDGQDLHKELENQKQFAEDKVFKVLIEILEVLKIIHKQGIFHRDIKPSNIITVNSDMSEIYLIDFGAVTKDLEAYEATRWELEDSNQNRAKPRHSSYLMVTPGFSPPEQQEGENIYASGDLYSLAATCISLLTGEFPPRSMIKDRFNENYERRWNKWQTKAQSKSQKLYHILEKMLKIKPEERYKSAQDVLLAAKAAWFDSAHQQNTSHLLSQQELEDEMRRVRSSSLSEQEDRFLIACQVWNWKQGNELCEIRNENWEQYNNLCNILKKFVAQVKEANKVDDPRFVIKQVLFWTNGEENLANELCQLILNSSFISRDKELEKVENLVKNFLCKKTNQTLRNMSNNLLNNKNCAPSELLESYRQILSGEMVAHDPPTAEQQELFNLKLVATTTDGKLRVYNLIYQEFFNPNWITQNLRNLKQQTNIRVKVLSGLVLLLVLSGMFWSIFLRSSPQKISKPIPDSKDLTVKDNFPVKVTASNCKINIDVMEEKQIQELEDLKRELRNEFPQECSEKLNKFLLDIAEHKATRGLVVPAAVEMLCKITENSDQIYDAKDWLIKWKNDPYWSNKVNNELETIPSCPAARDL